MIVKMTKAAVNKLKELAISDGAIPRIDAAVAGGCGISVQFSIVFDEPRRNDLCIETDGIQLRMDRFTKRNT